MAQESGYWDRMTRARLSRRGLLRTGATLGAGVAALSLVGCGGGDEEPEEIAGLLGRAQDTTKEAKPGGTWQDFFATDIVSMDPIANNSSANFPNLVPVYQTLVKSGMSDTRRPGAEGYVGDAASSWEFSPDATRITLKLRPNNKWDPRPPTNGRAITTQDVKWSWDKYVAISVSAVDLVKAKSPEAPIDAIEFPDAQTVVFKLAYPYASILDLLVSYQNIYVEPADDNFDFKLDMRGSGPFMLDNYVPSQSITYKKNPNYFDLPQPFFDVWHRTLITQYATGLAQFQARHIYNYVVNQEDIINTKRANPDMLMLASHEPAAGSHFINISKRDDSIFKDVRVRRAFSMLFDRDLYLETFNNVQPFRDAGLPIDVYWHSHIAAGLPEWVDPKGSGLGEGAQYFQHNPAEARKLVEAAGLKTPVDLTWSYFIDMAPDEQKNNEIFSQMINDSGVFNATLDGLLYNTSWRQARQSGGMGFPGVLYTRGAQLPADQILTQKYTPNGRNAVSSLAIAGVTDLVQKQKTEPDPQKRTAIVQEIQKKLALEWPDVMLPGSVPGFSLRWPWLRNHGVFIEGLGGSARSFTRAWYDEKEAQRLGVS